MKSKTRSDRKSKLAQYRKLKSLERFVAKQIEKYVKLHKKHEKDLRYIG